MKKASWHVDPYEDWLAAQHLPVVGGLAVDLSTVETKPWDRTGVGNAVVHLDARGDFANLIVFDLPPAGETTAQRHIYEEIIYVLDGRGSTVVEDETGTRSFEWSRGSLFAIPINMSYRHLNASGERPARLVHTTNLPMVMRLFRDEEFVFESPHRFAGRAGYRATFDGSGTFVPVKEHRHMWETNLVPNVLSFDELRVTNVRGRNSLHMHLVLADGSMGAHISEIPSGDYKKAHRHIEGFQIFQFGGGGYSLYWWDGQEPERIDWRYGLVHSPSNGMWHQHFNTSDEPARYMALSFGSIRYPYTEARAANSRASTIGADQIEYEDEDPNIRRVFESERRMSSEGKTA
jgi:quercetin dioxygenase-like cupin family protein